MRCASTAIVGQINVCSYFDTGRIPCIVRNERSKHACPSLDQERCNAFAVQPRQQLVYRGITADLYRLGCTRQSFLLRRPMRSHTKGLGLFPPHKRTSRRGWSESIVPLPTSMASCRERWRCTNTEVSGVDNLMGLPSANPIYPSALCAHLSVI